MKLPLPDFVDERFLRHRLQSTSNAGMLAAALALCLFAYRAYHDHAINLDLLAVGATFIVVKYTLLFWYRRTD
jgi:hypothetical protein